LAALQKASSLQRLQFELALDMSAADSRPPTETLNYAAQSAGAEVVFVLPTAGASGVNAVVRLVDDERDCFLQVRSTDTGLAVIDESEMEPTLIGLARALVDVMRRLATDGGFRESRAA
jgi:hypothetical protein